MECISGGSLEIQIGTEWNKILRFHRILIGFEWAQFYTDLMSVRK